MSCRTCVGLQRLLGCKVLESHRRRVCLTDAGTWVPIALSSIQPERILFQPKHVIWKLSALRSGSGLSLTEVWATKRTLQVGFVATVPWWSSISLTQYHCVRLPRFRVTGPLDTEKLEIHTKKGFLWMKVAGGRGRAPCSVICSE